MIKLITHSILAFILVQCALAKPAERLIEARTLCYAKATLSDSLYTYGRENVTDLPTPLENFSARFKCKLKNSQAIFFVIDGKDDEGKPVHKPIALAKVPSHLSRVLFYFIPNKPDSEMAYQVRVFSDDFKDFPLGHTRIINLNSSDARFIIGEHKCQLTPNSLKTLPIVKKRSKFNMAPLRYAQLDNKKQWRVIRDKTTKFTERKRLLIIACHDPRTKRPDIRIYKDFPPPADSSPPIDL